MVDRETLDPMVAEYALGILEADEKRRLEVMLYEWNEAQEPPHPEDSDDPSEQIAYQAWHCKTKEGRAKLGAALGEYIDDRQHLLASGEAKELLRSAEACKHYMEKYGVPFAADNETQVAAAFAQAQKLAAKIEQERLQGIYDESDFQSRVIGKWRADLSLKKDAGIPLTKLFQLYREEWSKSHDEARVKRKVTELKKLERVFTECAAEVPKAKEVSPEMALQWREYYQHEFSGDTLSNKTVNNALETMSAVFNFGMKQKIRLTEMNPFCGLQLSEGVKSDKTRIFEPDELQAYIDMLAELHDPEKPEKTWIPIIMAFSGMRCNEVAQLFVDDVQSKDGIDFFRVTENRERRQRIKTEESRRDVPIHSKLVDWGFLRYVEKMRYLGSAQLFPNCAYHEYCGLYYDANFSSHMNELVNAVSADRRLRLYSLRANFRCSVEEALMAPGLAAHDRGEVVSGKGYNPHWDLALDNVMGHKIKGNTGVTVYRKRQLSIMNSVVQMAAYPVDFSRLEAVLGRSS